MNSDYAILSQAYESLLLSTSADTQTRLKALLSRCQTASGRVVAQSLLTLVSSPDRRAAEARTLLNLSHDKGAAQEIRCLAAWLAADVFRELCNWERCRLACDLVIAFDENHDAEATVDDTSAETAAASSGQWIQTSHRARLLRAHALRQLGDASTADLELTILLDEPNLPPNAKVAATIDLANSLWQNGDKDRSISLLKSISSLTTASRWADAMHNLARMTASVGDNNYAREILQSLTAHNNSPTIELVHSVATVLDSARNLGEHDVISVLENNLPAGVIRDPLVRFIILLSKIESGKEDEGLANAAKELVRLKPSEREYVIETLERAQSQASVVELGDAIRISLAQLDSEA